MQGMVAVVTGGTSGIGEVAAERLAAHGARIVLIARDPVRAEQTLTKLRSARPGVAHSVHLADLASIAQTRAVGARIAEAEPRIDVLINNAGAMFSHRQVSPDGLEMTFAVNHMAYFVLTEALSATLTASPGARVINTASAAHKSGKLDFDDLQSAKHYSGLTVYGTSKLCNILFTRELARRLADAGVTANCLHPGLVATRFGDQSGGVVQALIPLARRFAVTPQQGADTIVYLATSPDVAQTTGRYFYKRQDVAPSAAATDDDAAARLWAASEAIAAAIR